MDLQEKWNALTQKSYGKDLAGCTEKELYYSLLDLTKNEIAEKPLISGDKKVYYISAEFLIGKLLSNNLINLGIYADVKRLWSPSANPWQRWKKWNRNLLWVMGA